MKYLIYLTAIIPPAVIEYLMWQDHSDNVSLYNYPNYLFLNICTTATISLAPALLIAALINKIKAPAYTAIVLCLICFILNFYVTREISYLSVAGGIFGIYVIRIISTQAKRNA